MPVSLVFFTYSKAARILGSDSSAPVGLFVKREYAKETCQVEWNRKIVTNEGTPLEIQHVAAE